jgi:hypothetical protein|eukprot:COSAG03_NODE_57_length_15795_cov_83.762784_9_plen_100_part_00
MKQFKGKGSFAKRGEKPLKPSTTVGSTIQRVGPLNDADVFHLGQVKLTDGLPIPAPRAQTSNSVESGGAESGGDESGGADGIPFSAFDDLLATSTVGRT